MSEQIVTYYIAYGCSTHGLNVKAVDRTWCWFCFVERGEFVKVDQYVAGVVPQHNRGQGREG